MIHLFDKEQNSFKKEPELLPMNFGQVDKAKKIFWGYRDAQYQEDFDYSILYTYRGLRPYVYFKLIYHLPNDNGERKDVSSIQLYKFKNGIQNNENLIFIKRVKTGNLSKFNYKNFWKKHYGQLLSRH